ncbi:MAG: hypothetical protein FWH20_05775, partial [Oscillospiraceae bacterium]|nr:hypothetical protein [Oscillospiraceae bacterium]
NIQSSTVIASSIWQIIIAGETAGYDRLMGTMTIPESDVEIAARSIFGTGFEIHHRTIDYFFMQFEYSTAIKSYIVPEEPAFFTFSPQIAEISKPITDSNGEVYSARVEYIVPTPMSLARADYETEPVKTMVYTILRHRDKSMTILSIEFDRELSE